MLKSNGRVGHALEFAVAIAALVTSVTSIWLSLSQGDEMARLVQAQSWPYLEYVSSNTGDNGAPVIDIMVRNAGVGPAKVESFSISYEGKPVRGWAALIGACCVPKETRDARSAGADRQPHDLGEADLASAPRVGQPDAAAPAKDRRKRTALDPSRRRALQAATQRLLLLGLRRMLDQRPAQHDAAAGQDLPGRSGSLRRVKAKAL